jgi:hypothetical protein
MHCCVATLLGNGFQAAAFLASITVAFEVFKSRIEVRRVARLESRYATPQEIVSHIHSFLARG